MAKLKVKNSGGNGYEFYNEAISKMIKEEEELDDAISKALEKEELYLVYQPIVDITTSEIISNEALLRWGMATINVINPIKTLFTNLQLKIVSQKSYFL